MEDIASKTSTDWLFVLSKALINVTAAINAIRMKTSLRMEPPVPENNAIVGPREV
jgi:hypothetical protein